MTRLRTGSLRRRVTLLVLGVLAVVVLGMLLVVDTVFAAETNRDLGAVLAGHERLALTLAGDQVDPVTLMRRVDSDSVRARLTLADGQVFGSLPGAPPPRTATRQATITLHPPGPLAGARLTLVAETSAIEQAQAQLRRVLALVGLVALVVTGVVLVVTVRVALSPLDVMAGLARSVASGSRVDGCPRRGRAPSWVAPRPPSTTWWTRWRARNGRHRRRRSGPGGSSRTRRTSCARRSQACRRSRRPCSSRVPMSTPRSGNGCSCCWCGSPAGPGNW